MTRYSRRAALKGIGTGLAFSVTSGGATARSGAGTAGRDGVETVVDIPGEPIPENFAIDGDGTLYFGVTRGEVRKLTPAQTQETGLALDDTEQVATLPGNVIGVELVPGDGLYVASQADAGTGVWRAPDRRSTSTAGTTRQTRRWRSPLRRTPTAITCPSSCARTRRMRPGRPSRRTSTKAPGPRRRRSTRRVS